MKPRINYAKAAPGVYEAMDALDQYLARCGLEPALLYLVQLRASQINGCAYCLDMHWKDLRAAARTSSGSTPARLARDAILHRPRTGGAGLGGSGHVGGRRAVPQRDYEDVRPYFSEKELSDLTLAIAAINAWNRLSIAARLTPGTYQPTKVMT